MVDIVYTFHVVSEKHPAAVKANDSRCGRACVRARARVFSMCPLRSLTISSITGVSDNPCRYDIDLMWSWDPETVKGNV